MSRVALCKDAAAIAQSRCSICSSSRRHWHKVCGSREASRDLPPPCAPPCCALSPRNTLISTCSNNGSGPRRRVRSRAVSISGALCPDAECHRSAQGGMVRPASRLAGKNGEQRVGFHGVSEQPPLPKEAAVPAQELQLLARLHALGDELQIETLYHVDDGSHQLCVVGVHGHVAHEGLVYLQGADRKLLQSRKRRVSGAKIVDGQMQSHGIEFIQKPDGSLRVGHQCGFREFQLETGGRNAVLAKYVAAAGDEARLLQLPQRQVDRDSARLRHGFLPFTGV